MKKPEKLPTRNDEAITWGEFDPHYENLAKALGLTTAQKAFQFLQWIDNSVMKGVGVPFKKAESMGFISLDYDDPEIKDFAYHNSKMFRAPVTALWAVKEAWKRGLTAESADEIFQKEGEKWAEDNPEVIDDAAKFAMTWWATGLATKAIKAPWKMAEIAGLTKTVKEAQSFKGAKQIVPVDPDRVISFEDIPRISAAFKRSENLILLNPKKMAKDFVNQAWFKPKLAGVFPIAKDAIKTPDEFRRFLIGHEAAHAHILTKGPAAENTANMLGLRAVKDEAFYHFLISGKRIVETEDLVSHKLSKGMFNSVRVVDLHSSKVYNAMAKTYGAPIGSWLDNILRLDGKPEDIAEQLWATGYRSKEAVAGIPHAFDTAYNNVMPKFFRWPENLYSNDIRDVAINRLETQEALRESYLQAWRKVKTEVPRLTDKEAEQASRITLEIGRPEWLPAEQAPDFIKTHLSNMVSSGQWKGELPTEKAVEAAGVLAKFYKQGHRTGTLYDPKFGGKLKLTLGTPTENMEKIFGKKFRWWREPRLSERVPFTNEKEMLESLKKVLVREETADKVDLFRNYAAGRIKELRKLSLEVPTEAHRFKKEAKEIVGLANELENWAAKDFGIAKAGGPIPKNWRAATGFIAWLQLQSPAFHFKNAVDTLGTKNLLGANLDLGIWTHTPWTRRVTGLPLRAGTTFARDTLGTGASANLAGGIENYGRQKLLSWTYQKELNKAISRGIPIDLADEAAFKIAKETEGLVHINYPYLSGLESSLKYVNPFAKFYAGNLNFYANLALNHPAEALAAFNALEFQREHISVDRRGGMSFMGRTINPLQLVSFNKIAGVLSDPRAPIDLDQSYTTKLVKAGQFMYGPTTPILDWLTRPSDDWRGQTYLQSVVGSTPVTNIIKSLSRSPAARDATASLDIPAPVGASWENLFGDPDNDKIRMRQIKTEMAAAQLEGNPIPLDQAASKVDLRNSKDILPQFLFGIYPEPGGKGHQEIQQKKNLYINEFGKEIQKAKDQDNPDEVRALEGARRLYLELNPEIRPLVPIYPGIENKVREKIREAEENKINLEEVNKFNDSEKQSFLQFAPADIYAKAKEFLTGIRFKNPFVSEAAAEEVGPQAVERPVVPVQRIGKSYVPVPEGSLKLDGKTNKQKIDILKMSEYQALQYGEHLNRIQSFTNSSDALKYVGENPDAMDVIKAMADQQNNFQAQQVSNWSNNPYNTAQIPQGISGTRKRYNNGIFSLVNAAWPDPGKMKAIWDASANVNTLEQMFKDSRVLPAGTDMKELRDPNVLPMIRLELEKQIATMISKGGQAYREKIDTEYPVNKLMRQYLSQAAYNDPEAVYGLTDQINKMMEADAKDPATGKNTGKKLVSPDFWSELEENDFKLYGQAAISDQYQGLRTLKTFLTASQAYGKIEINKPYLLEIARRPEHKAQLSAVYHGSDARFQQAFDDAAVSLGLSPEKLISSNLIGIAEEFAGDYNYRTGQAEFFSEIMKHKYGGQMLTPRGKSYETFLDKDGNPLPSKMEFGKPVSGEGRTNLGSQPDRAVPTPLLAGMPDVRSFTEETRGMTEGNIFGLEYPAIPMRGRLQGQADDLRDQSTPNVFRIPNIPADLPQVERQGMGSRRTPWRSTGEMLRTTWGQYQTGKAYAEANGEEPPPYSTYFNQGLWYKAQVEDPNNPGTFKEVDRLAINPYEAVNAVSTLGHVGMNLFDADPNSGFARGMAGFNEAVATFSSLVKVDPTAGLASSVIAVASGIKTGLRGVKRPQLSADIIRERQLQQERQQQEFIERQKQVDIRSIQSREAALTRAFQAGAQFDRARIAPQLQRFQRRPTFASRLGLVDALTRELGTALKPRW